MLIIYHMKILTKKTEIISCWRNWSSMMILAFCMTIFFIQTIWSFNWNGFLFNENKIKNKNK
jgi:hypothetical protein